MLDKLFLPLNRRLTPKIQVMYIPFPCFHDVYDLQCLLSIFLGPCVLTFHSRYTWSFMGCSTIHGSTRYDSTRPSKCSKCYTSMISGEKRIYTKKSVSFAKFVITTNSLISKLYT